jgi:hypothetical protein
MARMSEKEKDRERKEPMRMGRKGGLSELPRFNEHDFNSMTVATDEDEEGYTENFCEDGYKYYKEMADAVPGEPHGWPKIIDLSVTYDEEGEPEERPFGKDEVEKKFPNVLSDQPTEGED